MDAFLKRLGEAYASGEVDGIQGGQLEALVQVANSTIMICKPEERCLLAKKARVDR